MRDDSKDNPKTEAGMTTAEYTVGTLGACSIAAILIKLAQTPWFGDLVKGLLDEDEGGAPDGRHEDQGQIGAEPQGGSPVHARSRRSR